MGVVFLVIMGVVTYRQHPPEKKVGGQFFFQLKEIRAGTCFSLS